MPNNQRSFLDDLEYDTVRNQIKATTDTQIALLLHGLDPTQREGLRDRLYRMIEYAIERHDWFEEQKGRFLEIAAHQLTLVSIAASVLASDIGASIPGPIIKHAIVASATLIISSVFVIVAYREGIKAPHPHRKFSNIASWIFHYKFPKRASRFPVTLHETPVRIDDTKKSAEAYQQFIKSWVEMSREPNGFLAEDIRQVFALMSLQKHGLESLQEMRQVWEIGMLTAAGALIAGFLATTFGVFVYVIYWVLIGHLIVRLIRLSKKSDT